MQKPIFFKLLTNANLVLFWVTDSWSHIFQDSELDDDVITNLGAWPWTNLKGNKSAPELQVLWTIIFKGVWVTPLPYAFQDKIPKQRIQTLKGPNLNLMIKGNWHPITMTRSKAKHYLRVNLFCWTHHSLICDPGHAMFIKMIGFFTNEWHQIISHELRSRRSSSESSFWFLSGLWVIFVIVPAQAKFSQMCQGNIMASK